MFALLSRVSVSPAVLNIVQINHIGEWRELVCVDRYERVLPMCKISHYRLVIVLKRLIGFATNEAYV